jgi:hypothetical protein
MHPSSGRKAEKVTKNVDTDSVRATHMGGKRKKTQDNLRHIEHIVQHPSMPNL